GPFAWCHPVGLGRALDLQAVLVGTGEEPDVVTDQTVPTGDRIGGDGRVGVADVGRVVHVVDRRGQVEAAHGRRLPAARRPPRGDCVCRHRFGTLPRRALALSPRGTISALARDQYCVRDQAARARRWPTATPPANAPAPPAAPCPTASGRCRG